MPLFIQGSPEGGSALRSMSGAAIVAAVLYGIFTWNFLLFHSLAELFSVVVAFAAFVVAWHSRRWIGYGYLLVLGFGHLFVGGIDTVHTLAYKGMHVLDEGGGNLATQLWLAGRSLEAGAFLLALALPRRHYSPAALFTGFSAVALILLATVFGGVWPVTFIDGAGVTTFKTAVELAVIGLYLVCLLLLSRRAADFDPQIRSLLVMAVAAKAITELAFTAYVDLYGLANFIGHMLKIGSSMLFLRAIVVTGLRRPQALVFGAIDRERLLSEEAARHATTLDAVLEATLDPVVMVDRDCRFRFASRAAERFFGRAGSDLAGKTWREAGLPPAIMIPLAALCARVHEGGQPLTEDLQVEGRGGPRCLEVQASPVAASGVPVDAVVVVIRDITARRAMEEELRASLEDNRVLMVEVHHRVKNNLQIVSSILQMQGWRVSDPEMRGQFDEACGRILSLAKVHEMLYKQDNPSSVDFVQYVHTLCDEMFRMHGVDGAWVALKIEAGSLPLPLDQAVPLALIVHELISHSLKTAFKDKGGELRIRVAAEGEQGGALAMSDDGPGLALADFDGRDAALGMRMVAVLAKQIHGTLDAGPDGVSIRFPLSHQPAAPREAVVAD